MPARTKAKKPAKKKPAKKPARKPAAKKADRPSPARDANRRAQAAISRVKSATEREIGPLAPVKDPERKAAALASLRTYCETYKRAKFFWDWSPDQLKAIARMEECALHGGHFAIALTRGGGKTELVKSAAEWSVLKGLRRFVVPIGATEPLAGDILRDIKSTFETNDLLAEDFPEVCQPIRALEGITNRCKGQTLNGKRTNIKWGEEEIRLPTVEGSACSGAVILTRGITGALRGLSRTAPDGGSMRPDFVIPDDVQTRESAKSPTQTHDRELIILGDVLELAGPQTSIAAVMPCTVIYPNDLSERFLDRQRHPSWRGERFKAVYRMPDNMDLWRQYAEIRADSLRAGRDGAEATDFLRANFDAMHAGADVAWPERMKAGEISGLQSAMNVFFDKPDTFAAEWQNEPKAPIVSEELHQLDESDLERKLNTIPRGTVPRECNKLTAFVDVQAEVLFWAVCGWTPKFGGALVDYGSFPEQPVTVFTAAAPPRPLSSLWPSLERTARIYSGLAELMPQLLARGYRQDGADGALTVVMALIDSGWETDAVHDFLSRSPLRAMIKPSKGKAIDAASKPMNQYRVDPGDVVGDNWRIDAKTAGKGRFVSFDTSPWKTAIAERILTAPGATSSFYLPGSSLREHPLLTTHLLSEFRAASWGQGRRVEKWSPRPDRRENHWWDCVIGCAVAASVSGLTFSAAAAAGDNREPDTEKKRRATREDFERKRREFEARRGY